MRKYFVKLLILCLGVGGGIFLFSSFSSSFVYAQDVVPNTDEQSNLDKYALQKEAQIKFVQNAERVLKLLYLILRPLLAIAGASMDNTLVYGSIFYLDTMLWKFRQIIRTFANMGIGFVFLASILGSFFGQKVAGKELKDILKSTFIAGVLVQMSWWIFAVLMDLSTIGVVALGALPLNVLNTGKGPLEEMRFLKMHGFYNMNVERDNDSDPIGHNVVYSCAGDTYEGTENSAEEVKTEYYIPCWLDNGYLIEKEKGKDAFSRQQYKEDFIKGLPTEAQKYINESTVSDEYCVYGYDLIKNDAGRYLTCEQLESAKKAGIAEMKTRKCSRLADLTKGAGGMTGPFFTLFASLMRMGNFAINTNTKGLVETGLGFALKSLIGIALVIPLFALAVVMIVRVVILRLLIAFSPILTLLYVYKFSDSIEGAKIGGGNISNIKDVLGLIFMPVFVVFAVSLSLVFLSLIARPDLVSKEETACQRDPASILSCVKILPEESSDTPEKRCYDMCGITEMCFTDSERTVGTNILNTMGWLVSSFFGIAMMRVLVFAALKSSKITSGIVTTIEGRGKMLGTSIPFIPLPGNNGKLASLGTAKALKDRMSGIPDTIARKQWEGSALADKMQRLEAKLRGSNTHIEKSMDQALQSAETNLATGQSQAVQNVKNMSVASGTSYKDLGEEKVAKQYALAAGLPRNRVQQINTMEDALQDSNVKGYLAQEGLYDKLMKQLVNTRNHQVKQDLAEAIKKGLDADANARIGQAGRRDQLAGGGYAETYRIGDTFVQYITDDQAGETFREIKTYRIGNNLSASSTLSELQNFSHFVDSYGGLDNLPSSSVYNNFVTTLQNALRNATETDIGNYHITATKDSANHITHIDVRENKTQ